MVDATLGIPMEDERGEQARTDRFMDGVYERHRRLRGNDELLYFPPEKACTERCGRQDNDLGEPVIEKGKVVQVNPGKVIDHQCYYKPEHEGPHKFSSECALSIEDEEEFVPHRVPCSFPGCERLTTKDATYGDLCYEHIRADNE